MSGQLGSSAHFYYVDSPKNPEGGARTAAREAAGATRRAKCIEMRMSRTRRPYHPSSLTSEQFITTRNPQEPDRSCPLAARREHRSEERRVGKECRSRWS